VETEAEFSMSWLDKLQLIAELGPLLGRLQAAFTQEDPHKQALALVNAAKWAAGRTETPIDDEALGHLEAILITPQGRDFFHWFVKKLGVTTDE